MRLSQQAYNCQYYLLNREHLKTKRKEYYYRIRGTVPKQPKTSVDLLKERTVICPICKKSRLYTSLSNASRARRNNAKCNSCSNTIKKTGVKLTEQHKIKISIGNTGKFVTQETKRKLREARIKELQGKFNSVPNYNVTACHYFDNLSLERGWNLQHAMNGGEIVKCGYFLDAYDKLNNVVVEYDEQKHYGKRQKQRDIQKQIELIKELKCQFYRYDEVTKKLTKVN